jgi:predicted small secreted protein
MMLFKEHIVPFFEDQKDETMKTILTLSLIIAATLSLSACETVSGMGRDIANLGEMMSGQ